MFKISRLTDYATVVMTYLARHPEDFHNAKDITENTLIALPTVTKLLKQLTQNQLLTSHRGANGGYCLAKPAKDIAITDIIEAIDGELGITECSHTNSHCVFEPNCANRHNWRSISNMLYNALHRITLADMTQPFTISHFDFDLIRPTGQPLTTRGE